MDKFDINNIPEPFRGFLGNNARKKTDPSQQSISAQGGQVGARSKDIQDLMFLAAILMLCDE
ncbi:MAG: hypothetical protein FWC93_05355 [Defluviitaleaceae bacterium]|nr:hypothetical protein [Defluviitaleaceae bacterium]